MYLLREEKDKITLYLSIAMKAIHTIITAFFLFTFLLISSCKEDEPLLSRLELLTQKPWKLKTVAVIGLPATPVESTQADDTYTFSADGGYIFDEGGSKGDASDPQTITGSWEFAENETVIKLNYGGITFNQEIIELNSKTLKVSFNFIFDIEQTFGH